MATYALIDNGLVVNIIEWDGQSDWPVPQNQTLQLIPTETFVTLGSTFSNGVFYTSPNLTPKGAI
jgi:hypothetical protein